MAQTIDIGLDFIPGERGRLFSKVLSQTIPGAAALASSALFGVWILHLRPATGPNTNEATAPAPALASNPYGGLVDPRSFSGTKSVSVAQNFPLKLNLKPISPAPSAVTAEQENVVGPAPAGPQFGESAPLPVPRPTELGSLESRRPFSSSGRRFAQQNRRSVPPATPSDNRTLFEKFFGMFQTSRPVLAYASPEDGVLGSGRGVTSNPSPRYDRWTAVYDVAAHTVYMPNGTRLEAHSGLGNRLDDPRYINERMRGATPPNVYELRPREQLFHGVQALRLIPVGNAGLYGRTGLLAHTYMLGQNGDSFGCVSFKNYNAFLQAFQNGEVKRLVVVARQS
ncbi:MAG: tlde1 domain-containing protein [Methylocella sp.]